MRLSDVVSGASGLTVYAQVALVVAVVAFVGLLLYLFVFRRKNPVWSEAARLPLEDGLPVSDGREDSR